MPDQKKPQEISDPSLDVVTGGGLSAPSPQTKIGQGGVPSTQYIGETEKNVWKAPAGLAGNKRC
ncbi:hypothetical protein KHP62_15555 [Rhodobacteraceae bacterium NNCM2]|nr:hypothetical protein [Coraliihabitans acroporae]